MTLPGNLDDDGFLRLALNKRRSSKVLENTDAFLLLKHKINFERGLKF